MSDILRYGMIGGGIGSFIGAVHRSAAALDGNIELTCGAFDIDPKQSFEAANKLNVPRAYGNYIEMLEEESKLPDDKRINFVVIVTPNHAHFAPAKKALELGFHVVCEKPVTFNTEQALELKQIIDNTGLLFAVTHPYTSYPLIREAREIIKKGQLGDIRKIIVEYNQGWLSTDLENSGNMQASWRTDPHKAGKAGSIGDIGTHAFNMAEFVSGLQVTNICADVSTFVPNRDLDDDANILLRFENKAKGILTVSQICAGEENNLTIRVYGEKGGICWEQQEPNSLIIKWLDKPMQVLRAGDNNNLGKNALSYTRLPMGHPEGLIEAFANIYKNFASSIVKHQKGEKLEPEYPSIEDGIRTMQFIDAAIESSIRDKKWTKIS